MAIKECTYCYGSGKIISQGKLNFCNKCGGNGKILVCDICGKVKQLCEQRMYTTWVCQECERKFNIVFILDKICDYEDVEIGKVYKGIIERVERFGIFVKLNPHVIGLINKRNMLPGKQYKVGDIVFVKVLDNRPERKEIDFSELVFKDYKEVIVKKELPITDIGEFNESMAGKTVRIRGKVTQIQVTSGPTVFTVTDGSGITWAIALEAPGVRAYPNVILGDIVEIIGKVSFHVGKIQIEISDLLRLSGDEAKKVREKIEEKLNERARPKDVGFLIESEILKKLKPKIMKAAFIIRKAVFEGRPIILRHHADCDGYSAALALECAIIPLLKNVSPNPEAEWYLFKRRPSKAPFYELEDALKDIIFSIENSIKFGEELPLIIVVDNGSTDEDIPAYKRLKAYGIPILVIDHHDPRTFIEDGKAAVDEYVDVHVNPHLVSRGYYGLTAGMIATEVARFVNPEVEEKIKHLPAISGAGDKSKAPEFEKYKKIAKQSKGLEEENLNKIAEVLDHESYYWKFMDGKGIIEDILLIGCSIERHNILINAIYPELKLKQERVLKASLPHVKSIKLPNGIILNTLDVELYAPKFEYPSAGKLSSIIHDYFKEKYGEKSPILTLCYGPGFVVIRASEGMGKYKFDLNEITQKLKKKLPDAGIKGGGHSYAGTIKFFQGKQNDFLEELKKEIANL